MSGFEEVIAIAGLASTALSAVGSISAGNQQRAALLANAANAENAAKTNAGSALNSSEADAARLQDRARRSVATATNQASGDGVDISSGSPLDVMADTAAQGALDAEITRWRGVTQANAYLTSGSQTAEQATQQAQQAGQAGWINAGSTLLTQSARYAQSKVALKVPSLSTDGMGVQTGGLY